MLSCLGQRRAVTVFRLLTRGTIEERVQALQRWKVALAASLVAVDGALRGDEAGAGAAAAAAAAAAPPPPPLLQLLAEALPATAHAEDVDDGGGGGGGGSEGDDDDGGDGLDFDEFKRSIGASL